MDVIFNVQDLERSLSSVQVPIPQSNGRNGSGTLATASPQEIFRNYKDTIPKTAMRHLAAKVATGDRSRVLWRLSNALLEAGLTPGEVVVLIEPTVWNKFGADRSRLWADVNKAASRLVGTPNGKRPSQTEPWSVPLDRYLSVESRDPQWMIQDIWADKSHGIIAGEPKTRKSYVAIDIALAVATGAPCLGEFSVKQSKPVLMIQEEISDAEMRKRLRYIAESKNLGGKVEISPNGISVNLPDPIPLYLRNRKQFDLSSSDCLDALTREITEHDIGLVILDPLQMMLGGIDENRASEVRPILQNLLKLKEATGCGIMIVHHYAKASINNPRLGGQRMLGSQAFHGWVESALYLSKPEPYVTSVEREFRNFEPLPDFDIEFGGGNEGYYVNVSVEESKKPDPPPPRTKLDEYVRNHPGMPLVALAQHCKVSDKTLQKHVDKSPYIEIRGVKGKTGRPRNCVFPLTKGMAKTSGK
jgi:hypothetical protein